MFCEFARLPLLSLISRAMRNDKPLLVSIPEATCRLSLRKRGPDGVLGSELYSGPDLNGRSSRSRVSELRKDGHLIEGKPHGSFDWFYRLIRDDAGAKPQAESPDWYECATGQLRSLLDKEDFSSLPLFRSIR